ncbi:MAG: rhomboid family intramembrane serine protease [Deltaproteobacteria bacterium]|nr:rhomboid family intramembrane serine protease [Deltaproteobacteria bacterium]
MLLPIGDTPNPENYTPWANWLLIGINVAVYVLITWPLSHRGVNPNDPALYEYLKVMAPHLPRGISLPQLLQHIDAYSLYVFEHGYKAGAPQISDLFYSLFLHGGFMHLFGNMLFLWIYGDNVEHRLGHIPYLIVYIACGVCATLFFALFTSQSMTPLVGASGAISGVLGLYYVFFPRNQIKLFFFFLSFFHGCFSAAGPPGTRFLPAGGQPFAFPSLQFWWGCGPRSPYRRFPGRAFMRLGLLPA